MIRIIVFLLWFVLVPATYAAVATTNFATQPDVKAFINEMVQKYQFKESELVALFNTVKIKPKVIRNAKAPSERKSWRVYKTLFITENRIVQGVEFWNKYQDALIKAEKIYGVPASIIVATIGLETKYGRNTGDYSVFASLSTLAFSDNSRAAYFRKELVEFLLLTREQHLDPLSVRGSYAGAIGQPQFMPSSYRYYAVNFSDNPQIDLSHNEIDVIGSIANYYKKNGWQTNQPVAMPIFMLGGKYQYSFVRPKTISQSELMSQGFIPDSSRSFKIIGLESYYGNEYWLSFHNFDVIKRYNHSNLYAMAVYQLSYYISERREKLNEAQR